MQKTLALLIAIFFSGWVFWQSTVITSGGTLPATCVTGGLFVKTGASPGLYHCDATPAWVGPAATGGSGITELTGDVTAGPGSGSQAATIPNDTVTYAKMQDVSAASRILCRGSASGSGNMEECTAGAGITISGTTISTSAGGAGTRSCVVASSTQDQTSDTTESDDTALTFAADANSTYIFELLVLFQSSTDVNVDAKVTFNTLPSGASYVWAGNGFATAATDANDAQHWFTLATTGTGAAVGVVSTGQMPTSPVKIVGTLVTAGSSGNLTFMWAQLTSSATTLVREVKSYMCWQKQ